MSQQNTTYHEMPQESYPVHLFHPEFETLGLWFPALDAWVLEMLCQKQRSKVGGLLNIMEIGTFVGGSASILMPNAYSLLCVDTWAGSGKPGDEMQELYAKNDPFDTFLQNISQWYRKPEIHQRTTAPDFPDSLPLYLENRIQWESFDLIFIDGGHDYGSVCRDIAIAKEWIAPGGIICGHDFTMFDGVTKAVLDFGDDVGDVQACGTVWWKEMA